MKVLFVSSGTRNAGPNPIIAAQGKSLQKQGVKLEYFTIDRGGLRGYAAAVPAIRKVLENSDFDIVHAHYGLAALAVWLSRSSKKMVVSFMGDDLVGSNRSDGSVTRISLILARINAFLADRFYHYSIVKSKEMRDKLRSNRVSLVPNGADIERFYPMPRAEARKQLGIAESAKLAIFVSNPGRSEKNYALAEQAVRLADVPGLQLLALFNKNHAELNIYYNAADLLVMTSFHEGSPNVVKEAMACNCPIVSTDVGDVSWLFGDTLGCYLASFDPGDFARKIEWAIHFAETQYCTSGRQRIMDLGLDADTTAAKIINIYRQVLHGKTPVLEIEYSKKSKLYVRH